MATCYPTTNQLPRKWLFAPGMFAIAAYLTNTQTASLPGSTGYLIGTSLTFHSLCTIHIVYIQDGFPNFWRRVKDGDDLPNTLGFWKKIWWMLDLTYGSRKVGWVQEPRGALPPRPQFKSRVAFIASSAFWGAVHFVSMKLAYRAWAEHPGFAADLSTGGPETYLSTMPLHLQVLEMTVWSIAVLNFLALPNIVMAIASVASGLYDPEDCPSFFGSVTEAYTIRKYWG